MKSNLIKRWMFKMNLNLRVANDIGNSQTKIITNGKLNKQPSVVKKINVLPNSSETNVRRNVENLFDELLVHVSSKALRMNGMYMIGKRANFSSDNQNMNIKLGNKSKHDIPVLMTLSMNAASCVQLAFLESKELPEKIEAKIVMSTAIPASEYKPEKAKQLENRFLEGKHLVIVYVGDKQVTVELTYEKVKVLQEGVPALFAMIESNKDILRDYVKEYIFQAQEGLTEDEINSKFERFLEETKISPKEFLKGKRILHVDIGDGTTEYIYTIGLNPVTDACSGERRGVGHATDEARRMLNEELNGRVDLNRQQYMEALKDSTHNLHDDTVRIMKEARYSQAQLINEDIQ